MELAGALVQVVEMICSPVSKCWKYYKGVNEYIGMLGQRLEELNHRKKDIETTLEAEHNIGKRPMEEVELWLGMVEKINGEIKLIEQKTEKVKFPFRARVGKNLLRKIKEVGELYQKGDFPNGMVYGPAQTGDFLPCRTPGGETTFKRKMEEIWACLIDDEVRKIGVYGMGGIGKTTAMKHINNRLLEKGKNKFDNVIWITVSKASKISKLQDAIAQRLGLELPDDDTDETIRAAKLYARLNLKKRCVLILDDLWEVYRLEDVGIPKPTHENGCKIILTTRSLDVCRGMSCKSIAMDLLSQEEAWRLFLDIIDEDVLQVPRLEKIMKEVCQLCACLPLAIITVAGSLKGIVDYCEWRTALEELKGTKGPNSLGLEVVEKLEFSYKRLKDKNLQNCFLFCALYPEDFTIQRNELIEYLIVEGIISGMKSRQAEIEKGHSMLNKLVNACLLETSHFFGKSIVKMHDLVRDMAINTASSNSKILVKAGMSLRCIPDDENWSEDLERVSLMHNHLSSISFDAPPRCHKLVTLLLNQNYELQSIPNSFFAYMVGLCVLDLSDTAIESLPESVSGLVNLTALLLGGCRDLKYMPSLAALRDLRKLDLFGTDLTEVPEGVEMLTNLRYLNLFCSKIQRLPDGILSKLSRLQCLCLDLSSPETVKVLVDLSMMRNLESFLCAFSDIKHFNTCIRSLEERGPTLYKLRLGYDSPSLVYRFFNLRDESDSYENINSVHLEGSILREIETEEYPLIMIPKDINVLYMNECCIDAKSLCKVVSLEKLNHLRNLKLRDCGGIEYLLCTSGVQRGTINLYDMKRSSFLSLLQTSIIFNSLTELVIEGCDDMKKLFVPALLSHLQNLEVIRVQKCKQMVEIMGDLSREDEHDSEHTHEQGIDSGKYCLPRLRDLQLQGLPELKSIYPTSITMVSDSIQYLRIIECPKLKSIPLLDKQPCPPSLRKIEIQKTWWESLHWGIPNAMDLLQPFCDFL